MSGLQFWLDLFYTQWFTRLAYPTGNWTGKTIVITGANQGLGFEAARHYVRLNAAKVILGCRSTAKGEDAKREIESSTQRTGVVEVWPLDLQDYDSVREFANQCNTLPRIDVLLESAGIATATYQFAGGNESSITTNVVSTFLLALLVLPKLKAVAQQHNIQPIVTVVTSETHAQPQFKEQDAPQGQIFNTLSAEKTAIMGERYPLTKLLEILIGRAITAQHPQPYPVVLNLVNPGFCHSGLMREAPAPIALAIKYIFGARTTEQGSRTLVHGTTLGPESHGQYVTAMRIEEPSAFARSAKGDETGRRLWAELSEKLEAIQPGVTKNL